MDFLFLILAINREQTQKILRSPNSIDEGGERTGKKNHVSCLLVYGRATTKVADLIPDHFMALRITSVRRCTSLIEQRHCADFV